MSGIFITFEGIDGCGKSTVSSQAASLLKSRGFDVYHTMEPSENWLGEQVRRSYTEEISPYTELFLFLADRATHTDRIKKELAMGKIVISDRYADSSTAYQGALLENELAAQEIDSVDWIMKLNETIWLAPDMTLLLDIDPDTSLERLTVREELSKFEKKNYLEKVRTNYLRVAEADDNGRVKIVDAKQPVEKVLADVMELIDTKL